MTRDEKVRLQKLADEIARMAQVNEQLGDAHIAGATCAKGQAHAFRWVLGQLGDAFQFLEISK